jgi:hypothetical protein
MSAFIRLDTFFPSPLGAIPVQDIKFYDIFETSAYEHWIFNQGDSVGLTGRVGGRVLGLQSSAPEYNSEGQAQFITLPIASGSALLTDRVETATAVDTLCCVVRPKANIANFKAVLMGSHQNNAPGGGPFFHSVNYPKEVRVTYQGLFQNSVGSGSAADAYKVPADAWYFVAVTRDFSGTTKTLRSMIGGGPIVTLTSTNSYSPSPSPIALGNAYDNRTSAGQMDFAEFIIFDRAMSSAELTSLYTRRKRELAALSIPVA